MSRILALEWDRRELRYVVARPRGARLSVDAAGVAPVVLATSAGATPRINLRETLQAALGSQRLGGAVTLVGVGRSSVELLELEVPPAKDAELPDLVLNQALRQSPAVSDETPLDFVPLTDDPHQPRRVLAAALAAETLKQIQDACAAAKLRPQRALLRPLGTLSLFARQKPDSGVTLLVNVFDDEVDLTVSADGRPAYLRTVRLPAGVADEKAAQRLVAEIKRTLAVGGGAIAGDRPLESVQLVAGPGEHDALWQLLQAEVGLPVERFDPLEAVGATAEAAASVAGRLAPLLGMILDEGRGKHALDFLHPRKVARADNRRQYAVLGGGLLLMAAIGTFYFWDSFNTGDVEVQELNRQLRDLNAQIKKTNQQRLFVAALKDWQKGDITWLDELRDLSTRFPSARDMVLLRMSLTTAGKAGGGDIDMQGVVRDQAIVDRMVNNIRDEYHRVYPKRVQERLPNRAYAWHFLASLWVARRDKTQFPQAEDAHEEATSAKSAKSGAAKP